MCYVMKWCHITVFCSMENQTPVFVGQTSQTQPLFANDQWAYCLSASIEQLDGQHSQQVTITYLIIISFGYQFILIATLYSPIMAWSLNFFAHKMNQPVLKMLKKFLVLHPHHVKEADKRRFQEGVVGSQKMRTMFSVQPF
jgi:hypothetical protein